MFQIPKRRISFTNSTGLILASSEVNLKEEDTQEEVIKNISTATSNEDLFVRLKLLSKSISTSYNDLLSPTPSMFFVDQNGRVLATSTSPRGSRKNVKTVESQLLSGTVPTNSSSSGHIREMPSFEIWDKLKEISRNIESNGPSLY